jgi:SAM-dependent methyltransferase
MTHAVQTAYDLDELAGARRLRDWMWEHVGEGMAGRVVEVGPGLGTFTDRLLERDVEDALLLEPDPAFARALEERFGADARVRVRREGLPHSPALRAERGRVDAVLCQNVLEHVEDDMASVRTMAEALRPGGRLTVLVPAHPRLFNRIDQAYGHVRRYTRARLRRLASVAELEVLELRSFNLLGVPGWWAKGIVGAEGLDRRSLRAYEAVLPAWRPLERRLPMRFGLSLVLHAQR